MVAKITKYENDEIIEWSWSTDNKLLSFPYWTSCYVVGDVLIDSAAPGSNDELKEFILKLKSEEDHKINFCILTHAHEDHAGGANILKENFGIPVFAGKKAVKFLQRGLKYPQYRQITWGTELLPTIVDILPEKIISGSGKFKFEPIKMPGHAPCLVAFLERNRQWVFVGDAVLPKYTMIFGKTSNIPEDIHQIRNSIQKLYESTENMEDLKIFVAGHGLIKGRQFLKEKIDEIDELHRIAHQLHNEGLKTRKILHKMFGGETFIASFSHGDLSRENLLNSLLEWPLDDL